MTTNLNNNKTKLDNIFIDLDSDGIGDKYIDVDFNSDGQVDDRINIDGEAYFAFDNNLDGSVDSFLPIDFNKNGINDYTTSDSNDDGIIDVFLQNTNDSTLNNNNNNNNNNNDIGNIDTFEELMEKISNITTGAANTGQQAALDEAKAALIDSWIEAQASKKTLQMNNQANQQNAILDQQMLALRHNYNVLTKQTEQYVLDAQVREQLTNLFFSLEKTMMDNSFALAKTVVQSAKY